MQHILHLVDKYLAKQTQYAINIVGQWGKGKTYFYKNMIEPRIKTTPTLDDASRFYKPVYVSLFGLKSVDEIQVKIFNELLYRQITPKNNWFQSSLRTLKITANMVQIIFKGYQAFMGGKEIKGFSADVAALGKNVIDTNHIFVCFDDLERKSHDLSIEDFTGYVNTLVEQHIKVLIICNEDKIPGDNYKNYKEKIIDVSYEYDPNPQTVIDSIINLRYKSSPSYSVFLQEIREIIKDILTQNENNYRHLIYSLDNLHDIYAFLRQHVLDSTKDWAGKCREEMGRIAKFILSVSTEFKASRLKYNDRERFMASNSSLALWELMEQASVNRTTIPNSETGKFDEFLKKYYSDIKDYKHYTVIFDYITGTKELRIGQFESEFKMMHHLLAGKLQEQDELLKQLAYPGCMELSENEYKEKTEKMVAFALAGKYRLTECLVVFYYAKRFNNMLDLDLAGLADSLVISMKRISENEDLLKTQHLTEFDFEKHGETDELAEKIRSHGMSIYISQQEKNRENELSARIYFLTHGINELSGHYHSSEDFKQWFNNYPVLIKIEGERIAENLLKAKPHAVKFFESLFKDRYLVYGVTYLEEAGTLFHIKQKLSKHLEENTTKTIHRWAIDSLVKTLIKLDTVHGMPVLG